MPRLSKRFAGSTSRKIAACLVFFSLCAPAQAQSLCLDRRAVGELLHTRFSEVPASVGVTEAGGLVEVFTSKDGLTWTIIITNPNGRSCLVSSGTDWKVFHDIDLGPQA